MPQSIAHVPAGDQLRREPPRLTEGQEDLETVVGADCRARRVDRQIDVNPRGTGDVILAALRSVGVDLRDRRHALLRGGEGAPPRLTSARVEDDVDAPCLAAPSMGRPEASVEDHGPWCSTPPLALSRSPGRVNRSAMSGPG